MHCYKDEVVHDATSGCMRSMHEGHFPSHPGDGQVTRIIKQGPDQWMAQMKSWLGGQERTQGVFNVLNTTVVVFGDAAAWPQPAEAKFHWGDPQLRLTASE